MNDLLIIGAGQYGAMIKESARALNLYDKIDFLDDKSELAVGKIDEYKKFTDTYRCAIVAIGNADVRVETTEKLKEAGYEIVSFISRRAYVSPSAKIAEGCVIVGQHADSTGAPSACEAANKAGTVVYSVGYNVDMLSVAPTAALTSSTNNWDVYYTYAIKTALAGEDIATDWSEGYETGAVAITKLGDSCAAGTADAVAKAEADIKAGKLHVFDINTFTVGGAKVESTFCFDSDDNFEYDQIEAIKDGYYHESEYISAPSFSLRIDGITEQQN